ncbi:methyltransferase domain protein [Ostertagia ostertagi]
MANDVLYHHVAEIIKSVLAKEQSLRNAVYSNNYKVGVPFDLSTSWAEVLSFSFIAMYLTDESRVWEHNAWDNVDWSEEMKKDAHRVIETQKQQAVDISKAEELIGNPEKQWDAFYSQHSNNFFKDRRWLLKEFPELDMKNYAEGSNVRVLEVGCGVGNSSFPLLEWDEHRRMTLYSCDYSDVAVKVLKEHEKYDRSRMCGFVWDITEEPPEDAPAKESLDFVVCIYVLSAIHPSKVRQAIDNLVSLLKPGGMLLLKDYGRFDLTQLRFKKHRYIDENLYCRGDGTLVYFFSNDELDALLRSAGLVQKANFVDRRLIVNRAKHVKMYRQWLQNKKALLRLSCETLRFRALFDEILNDPVLGQITSDPELNGNINLAYVLLYEFLAGAGLGRASPRLRGAIYKHTKAIHDREKLLAEGGRGVAAIKEEGDSSESAVFIPRYARINTLKWTVEEAVERLKYEDWRVSCC